MLLLIPRRYSFLHTTYRSLCLLLNRPLLRQQSSDRNRPREKCCEAAIRMADLLALYNALHGLNRAPISFTHVRLLNCFHQSPSHHR